MAPPPSTPTQGGPPGTPNPNIPPEFLSLMAPSPPPAPTPPPPGLPQPPPPSLTAPPPPQLAAPGKASEEKAQPWNKSTWVDWIATNNPRMGGICPGEVVVVLFLVFTISVFLAADYFARLGVFDFLSSFSVALAAIATAGTAFEVWRNLRQVERTDEGGFTPHLWLLGSNQNRLTAPSHMTGSVTGLHELFLHNYGPGLAVDIRVSVDGKNIDRVPYIAPESSAQVGGALHGHALDGTHVLEVLYYASSGREHRLAGTLFRERDMGEILFRSDMFNHIYSVG